MKWRALPACSVPRIHILRCDQHSHLCRRELKEYKKNFTELLSQNSYPRDIPVLAGLKKIPQRIIVRYGNRLHPQAPSSSHSSWLSPLCSCDYTPNILVGFVC